MASNEHPDMSGNQNDWPFVCEICGKEFPEDELYGSAYDENVTLCSDECARTYDESRDSEQYD